MAEEELRQVKSMVRSVLLSCKEGVSSERFLVDYRDVTGEYLPYKKFGFSSVSDFVASIPDVINVRRQPGRDDVYHAVADETTAHIQKLVSKQRSKKTKRPLKKAPVRNPFRPTSNRPSGRGYPPPYRPQGGYPRPGGPSFQPHYAAIRRYGPPYVHPPRVRPPLLPTPISPEHWSSSPPSSPMGEGEPFQNFQITLRNSASKRSIGGGDSDSGRMIMRAMSEAFSDRQGDRKQNVKFGHKFEVPPRFRKHGMFPEHEMPEATSMVPPPANFIGDGLDYIQKLKDYAKKKNLLPLQFDTTQARGGFYVSSVRVDSKVFGSIEMFATQQEAEYTAAKNAYLELSAKDGGTSRSTSSSVSETDIRAWLWETLEPIPNGLWGTRIPVLFKEKFSEDAPSQFIDQIRPWTNLVEVESIFGRDLVKLVRVKPTVKWKEILIPEPDLLDPHVPVTVYVTFALRVDNFFVQKEDSCIDDINATLEEECKTMPAPDASVLKKGTFCAALYHEDESWYRAEVIQLTDESKSAQVTFVDYGNVEIVPVASIRQLPDQIASLPAQAIPCALYGIVITDTENVDAPSPSLREFSEVVKDSPITALTFSYNTDGQCEVMLTKDDLSVNMHLLKQGLVSTELEEWITQLKDIREEEEEVTDGPDTVILPDEKFLDLYVCFISPDLGVTVRIVGEEYSDKLDEFEAQLEECFKTASPSTAITAGQVCIASMDGLYQRVLVNAVKDNKAEGYFTDHGDTETLPIAQLRPLQPDLNNSLPYQAVRCYLHGLEKVTDTVTALESLLDLALGKTCVAEIVERDERLSVILYDTNEDSDININSAVSAAILAKNGPHNDVSVSPKSNTKPNSVSPSSKSSSVSPNSKSDNAKNLTNNIPSKASNLNRTSSTVSNESWGTEEEAEALAASYLESNSGSNWDSSDIASPDTMFVPKQGINGNSIANRLGGMSINSQTPTNNPVSKQEASASAKSSVSPQSTYGSDMGAAGGSETKKGLYTWGSPKEGDKKSRRLPPPELVDIPGVGEFFDVHVLWVSDPTNFWCTPYKMVLLLENMMKELNQYFTTNTERVLLEEKDLTLGSLYAGQVDNSWYRVITKSWIDKQMNVYFPDYGQYNILKPSDLQPLPDKFFALPLCAIKAKLHGINPIELKKPWSEAAKFKFMQLTQNDLVCLVCDKNQSSGMISVKLVDTSSEQDILLDEVLVDMNYARSLES